MIRSMDDYLEAAAPMPLARLVIADFLEMRFTEQQLARYGVSLA